MRERVRVQRSARPAAEQVRVADALATVLLELPVVRRARCVAVYASLPGEPGTEPVRRALRARGVEVLLPVVRPDLHLDWALDTGEPLTASSARGGPEPPGDRLGETAICRADVVLVPALAADGEGHRLGQGGGCYDRALPHARPDVPVLALLHDDEVLDAAAGPVPAEQHDRRVTGVVTPTRWIWLGAGAG
jgi:5-formyltetrahydrofolate cyclo-ligase